MAALTATIPTLAGVATPGAAVAASDTISAQVMGPVGCYLEILNGNASPDSMTITDFGSTPAGSQLPSGQTYAATVTNATNKTFLIKREQVNQLTQVVTITHSVTATVTYKLYPV